ncbi:MAG TPA: BrnA antitoxin family protein [Acidobacteriaceae bacterium]|nr:BrnA antitoxin family protein [Acidobacteriaceae bacterium]
MEPRYVDDLIDDDEIPELTERDVAQMVPFAELPKEQQELLLQIKHATIRPDPVKKPVTVALSADILDRFTATGEGWESRVDAALRQWLEEHTLPLPKAS